VNDAGGAPKREILREFKEKGAVKVVVPTYRKMLETHREVFNGVFGWLREGGLGVECCCFIALVLRLVLLFSFRLSY
jgi:hypothetical protein